VLIELSPDITAEALRANIGWKSAISLQRGPVEWVAATNHFLSQKARLNDLSYGIKIWTDLSSVSLQCTRLTDGRTDRILIARPRLHYMQRGKNYVIVNKSTFWRILLLTAAVRYFRPRKRMW